MTYLWICLLSLSAFGGSTISGSISDTANDNDRMFFTELQSLLPVKSKKIERLPNARAISYVVRGLIDFHYPVLLPLSNVKRKFEYAFSGLTVSTVVYAVYVKKENSKIYVHNLQNYVIEGESGHIDFFDFKVDPSSCPECSFKKLEAGRIDGYIYPALEGDEIIARLKLKHVDSYYFDTYEIKFALPANERGKEVDRLLTRAFENLKKRPAFGEIYREFAKANKNWKPSRGY